LAFEGFIELLSGLLGLDHRFTHTRLLALCLFCTCVRQIGAAPVFKETERAAQRSRRFPPSAPHLDTAATTQERSLEAAETRDYTAASASPNALLLFHASAA